MAKTKSTTSTIQPKSLVSQYKSGISLLKLAKQTKRSQSTIRGLLAEAGVTIRPRGRPSTRG